MTNSEKLLEAIGDVREELIPAPDREYPNSRRLLVTAGRICAALLIMGGCLLWYRSRKNQPIGIIGLVPRDSSAQQTETTAALTESQPPVIQPSEIVPLYEGLPDAADTARKDGTEILTAERIDSGSAGIAGGIAVRSEDELKSAIPWEAAAECDTLPVYRNCAANGYSPPVYLTAEQMTEIGARAAMALSVQVQSREIRRISDLSAGSSDDRAYSVVLQCGDVTVETAGDGEVSVTFSRGVQIPAEYLPPDEPDAGQEQAFFMWCAERFAGLLQFSEPAGYTVHTRDDRGTLNTEYYLYDKAESPAQTLLSSTVRSVRIVPENSTVMRLYVRNPLTAAEYLGDYPIMTPDEAKQLLLAQEQIREPDIADTALVYWYSPHQQNILPYYRFYVRADDSVPLADGLTAYGCCYVPAVRSEWIETEPAHPVQ